MMSTSDFDAIQKKATQNAEDIRRQRAIDLLRRCDSSHPQKIEPQQFIDISNQIIKDKNINVLRREFIKTVIKKIDKLNLLEAIYECLIYFDGSSGPHSFKFTLLSKLFGLTESDAKQSIQIVEDFVYAIKILKQAERRACAKALVEHVKVMTPEMFKATYDVADAARGELNSSVTIKVIGSLNNEATFLAIPFYLVGKGIKKATREVSHFSIKSKIERERHGVFDAVYDCLTSVVGQSGPHSFKYCFILGLAGFSFKDKEFVAESTPLGEFLLNARRFYPETVSIIQEMIQLMNAVKANKYAVNFAFIKECIEKCYSGAITKNALIDAFTAVRTKRDEVDKDAGATFAGMFTQTLKSRKTSERNVELNALIEKLSKSAISVLDALSEFLVIAPGTHGPHSFKYALLKQLFPDLNKDVAILTEVESSATIECFIRLIPEKKADGLQGMPLEEMTERKSPRRDSSM